MYGTNWCRVAFPATIYSNLSLEFSATVSFMLNVYTNLCTFADSRVPASGRPRSAWFQQATAAGFDIALYGYLP